MQNEKLREVKEQIHMHLGCLAVYADMYFQMTNLPVKAELNLMYEDEVWSHKPILRIEEQSND